jgi:proteasome lid subunit RPN8/RPN11
MAFRLRLPRNYVDAMMAQALAEQPHECCGLLAGLLIAPKEGDAPAEAVGQVVERYPLVNAAASPVEFLSEPRSLFAAHKDMRQRGLEILAVYHSHPTSEAVPSRTDLARNYSPDVVNLILSLTTRPPTVRAWWLTDADYREAVWEIVEGRG